MVASAETDVAQHRLTGPQAVRAPRGCRRRVALLDPRWQPGCSCFATGWYGLHQTSRHTLSTDLGLYESTDDLVEVLSHKLDEIAQLLAGDRRGEADHGTNGGWGRDRRFLTGPLPSARAWWCGAVVPLGWVAVQLPSVPRARDQWSSWTTWW